MDLDPHQVESALESLQKAFDAGELRFFSSLERLRDPRRQTLWGAPAPRSWFEQGSPFTGQAIREPQFVADVLVAD